MMLKTKSDPQREIQLIHIAKSKLGLDDSTYRQMLSEVCGVTSSLLLDEKGRRKLLDHLRSRGANISSGQQPGQTHLALAADKLRIERKIGAQLKALKAGWPYAYAVADRLYPTVKKLEFLTVDQLGKVSSALERTLRYRAKQEVKK
jgi:phage gp16-like protein